MTQHTIPFYAIKRLRTLGFKSYAEYLRSPEWAAVKWRYKHSKLPQGCQVCGARPVDLHHRSYKRIGGSEYLRDLVPLCRTHHKQVHAEHQGGPRNLYKSTNRTVSRERKQEQIRATKSRR
jgi:hypothetical protein